MYIINLIKKIGVRYLILILELLIIIILLIIKIGRSNNFYIVLLLISFNLFIILISIIFFFYIDNYYLIELNYNTPFCIKVIIFIILSLYKLVSFIIGLGLTLSLNFILVLYFIIYILYSFKDKIFPFIFIMVKTYLVYLISCCWVYFKFDIRLGGEKDFWFQFLPTGRPYYFLLENWDIICGVLQPLYNLSLYQYITSFNSILLIFSLYISFIMIIFYLNKLSNRNTLKDYMSFLIWVMIFFYTHLLIYFL
ncbi:hypothetical protein (mitochondrion) [Myxobolus squamalis]|uniref:Uncharacterized protein n=1 Tax=Myxobolus squamalis TaxID=59785 RepID=A0A678XD78_MYXSQ|nr:hypothetical protein [Myxobolus squamalis]